MINLLPNDVHAGITYARRNTILIHWLVGIVIGLVGVFGVLLFGYAQIKNSTETYKQNVDIAKVRLEEQDLTLTQERVENLSGSIKLALSVLSEQVFFSRLLTETGGVIPAGVKLEGLAISEVKGGIDLNFKATDYQTGTLVQVNLADPKNGIFEQADIQNIGCQPPGPKVDAYPCIISIRALFKTDDAQFTFTPGGTQ